MTNAGHRISARFLAAATALAVPAAGALAQAGGGAAGGGGGGIPRSVILIIAVVVFLFIIVMLFVVGQFINLYIQALLSNARVGILELVGMRLRKVDIRVIVLSRIRAKKAGIEVTTNQLETHYLAGGRVQNVVSSLIAANSARIELPWNVGTAIDLAGRDIFDAVNTSVNPKVIDCPNPAQGRTTIDAVAKDGIQLKARARVTVRTNLPRLVGGATEETIIARVGEGIVSAIGSADSHKQVLENPDRISKAVMARGLDAGTAFEILSIDIADVDVGENIGAKLQADQAEADKRRFQAEAEKRRAMAVAQEQEFKAEVQKNRALVVLAEAEIPKAISEAFRNGHLGVMDYYRLRNIQADTTMRSSIAGEPQEGQRPREG
ncbi:MAG TPA: flotillin-like protein FloA [Phycisphaerales bacterium]|nr:flotillin-like protein FloA [Phycisphaerales bacterium]